MNNCVCVNNSNNNSSFIKVGNGALLVIRFTVTYDYMGITHTKDSGAFSLGFTREIDLPSGATNVRLSIFYYDITWVSIYTTSFATVDQLCFIVNGSLISYRVINVPCN